MVSFSNGTPKTGTIVSGTINVRSGDIIRMTAIPTTPMTDAIVTGNATNLDNQMGVVSNNQKLLYYYIDNSKLILETETMMPFAQVLPDNFEGAPVTWELIPAINWSGLYAPVIIAGVAITALVLIVRKI